MAIERRQRRRRNGEEYVVWRVRWTNEARVKRAATFDTERAALKGYASHWNRHILARLGHLPIRDITPLTLTRFRADLEADGVGSETIRRCLVLLQSILARAVEWQRILSNPVRAVRKPRTRRYRAVVPLAPDSVEAIRRELAFH